MYIQKKFQTYYYAWNDEKLLIFNSALILCPYIVLNRDSIDYVNIQYMKVEIRKIFFCKKANK